MKKRTNSYLSLLLALAILFVLGLVMSLYNNQYTSYTILRYGSNIPQNFGVPWNLFSQQHENIVDSSNNNIIARGTYIYRYGYIYANNQWQRFEFPQSKVYDNWIRNEASFDISSLNLAPGEYWFIAYSCQYVEEDPIDGIDNDGDGIIDEGNPGWKCGCRTNQCRYDSNLRRWVDGGMWQIQRVSVREAIGNEFFMNVGDTVTFNNREVTLENVGLDGAILVFVHGVTEIIPSGSTEIVNGIEIRNHETFYENIREQRSATLIIREATGPSMEKLWGREFFLIGVGGSITISGRRVTLENVDRWGAIVVNVDGVQETITPRSTEIVNGVEIRNDETFYDDDRIQRGAILIIRVIRAPDLSRDYPLRFRDDLALIVGRNASVEHTLSAIDITADIQFEFPSQQITPTVVRPDELIDITRYNAIFVGSPCVNLLVEDIFGVTCRGWPLREGESMVKLISRGNRYYMLVAGTTDLDTRRAARAIRQDAISLSGNIEVLTTATDTVTVQVGRGREIITQ